MSAMMKAYVGMIVNGAKKNESPEDWANQILDSVPPHQVNELESLLKAPDWFAKLGTLNAGVGEYHVWFTELRSILLEFIHEDAQPEQGLTNDVVSTNLSGHEDDINRPEHEPGQPEASASGEPALVRSAEQGNASAHP